MLCKNQDGIQHKQDNYNHLEYEMTGEYFLHVIFHLQDKMQRRAKIIKITKREYMQTVAQNTHKFQSVFFSCTQTFDNAKMTI